MSKMAELLKKQEEIAEQIEAEKNKGREEAVHNVREAIKAYGITLREVKNVLVMRKPRAGAKSTPRKTTATKTTGAKRGRPAKK
jgi:DNA-binding protein H-NS